MMEDERLPRNSGQVLLPLVMLRDPVVVPVSRLAFCQPIVKLKVFTINFLVFLVSLILLLSVEVIQLVLDLLPHMRISELGEAKTAVIFLCLATSVEIRAAFQKRGC